MMKRSVYLIMLLLAGATMLPGCKKDKKKTNVQIDATNLTACPDDADCDLYFTERATLTEQFMLQSGPYRVFWSKMQRPGISSQVYILAPMGNSFELNGNDIANGRVKLNINCPACDYLLLKPVGGFVKGINTKPGKSADDTRWLVEAEIYLEAPNNASVKDTLYLKQYFDPNFQFN